MATDDWIKQSEVSIDDALTTYIEHLQDGDFESRGGKVVYRALMFAWLDVLTVTRVAAVLRESGDMEEALAAAKHIRNEVWNSKIEELRHLNPIMDDDLLLKKNTEGTE
ncbi:hypothetical protein P7F60_18320 [Rhizobium sp. YJ-22]|nr:hypothetical protein [Rhizobium sp. YJ-22]MDG3578356.1 hypothetical protein [Rhizobium sp. YJ-22]